MSKSSMSRPLRYWLVLLAIFALVASSCGNDDGPDAAETPAATETATQEPDEPAPEATEAPEEPAPATEEPEPASATEEPDEPEPAPAATEEPSTVVELGGGAVIDVAECPEEWDNYAGVTDTEIRFGSSLPRAGALAGFGTISDGIQLYFDNEEIGLIDGRRVVMVSRDDNYEPARTVINVEEMIDVENLLGFAGILGSPNNLAVRDTLNENCIPQLFNLTGLPDWGDPTNYPWTTGGLMSYDTEAQVWCQQISDELGEGATAAVLSLGNDAGEAWRVAFNDCATEAGIEVLDEAQHDPQADSVGSDIISLAATNADVLIVASSGSFCPQAVAVAASLPWEPMVFVTNGCQSISLFWVPIGPLANGIRLVNTQKDVADSSLADDEWVRFVRDSLDAQGIDPEGASHALGYTFAEVLHEVLLAAAEMDGGVNRTNLMRAMWQVDFESKGAIGNTLRRMNGATDSYMVEAGRVEELVVDSDGARYVPVNDNGEIISFEGQTGTFTP